MTGALREKKQAAGVSEKRVNIASGPGDHGKETRISGAGGEKLRTYAAGRGQGKRRGGGRNGPS